MLKLVIGGRKMTVRKIVYQGHHFDRVKFPNTTVKLRKWVHMYVRRLEQFKPTKENMDELFQVYKATQFILTQMEIDIGLHESYEIWRVYPKNDDYEVSTAGRIRRARDLRGGHKRGGIRKPQKDRSGYLGLFLTGVDNKKYHMVGRMVAETFVGECPDGMECNHKDGDKENNFMYNLEWITPSENCVHRELNKIKEKDNAKGRENKK